MSEDFTQEYVEPTKASVKNGAKKAVAAPVVRNENEGKVRIENRTPVEIDITLTDGSNLHLDPRQKGKDGTSDFILRKLVPPYLNKLVAKGAIKIFG